MDQIVFGALSGMMLIIAVLAGQNAILNVTVSTLSSTITLTCKYIGDGNETFIMWRNGSSFDVLTLRPDCVNFSSVDASYDPHRISYTCDAENNTYTLKISPIEAVDENATWSCAFQDPSTPDEWAYGTIIFQGISGNKDSGKADVSTSNHLFIIGIIVGIFLIAFVICLGIHIWKKRSCRHNGPIGIKNTIKGMFCHKQPDPEKILNEHELEKMNPEQNAD